MNNHYHLYKHLKGTKVGDLLGDSWFREHEQYKDYYAAIFLRDSWGKLPGHLSREGLILFSGGRATARDLVKKRLKNFNEAFDEMYKRQSSWVVPDRGLRDKICQQIVQAVVPVYRSYMQSYGPLVELDGSSSKYAKYSVQTLEQMLSSLFLPKPGRYASFKGRQLSAKFNNGVADLRRTTSAVV
jgi:exocyst complex protein 7